MEFLFIHEKSVHFIIIFLALQMLWLIEFIVLYASQAPIHRMHNVVYVWIIRRKVKQQQSIE